MSRIYVKDAHACLGSAVLDSRAAGTARPVSTKSAIRIEPSGSLLRSNLSVCQAPMELSRRPITREQHINFRVIPRGSASMSGMRFKSPAPPPDSSAASRAPECRRAVRSNSHSS